MAGLDATERILFMHSAHQTIGVSVGPAALGGYDSSGFTTAGKSADLLRVCLVSEGPEHKADGSLDVLARHLGPRYDVIHARARGTSAGGWSGPDDPRSYDCIVLLAGGSQSGAARLAQIERGYRGGRVIVGHGNSDPFVAETAEVTAVESSKDHPVLAGVGPLVTAFPPDATMEIPTDATVLLIARSPGRSQPVAWIRSDHRGRTFHTLLGRAADFHHGAFVRLLANAVDWTAP